MLAVFSKYLLLSLKDACCPLPTNSKNEYNGAKPSRTIMTMTTGIFGAFTLFVMQRHLANLPSETL